MPNSELDLESQNQANATPDQSSVAFERLGEEQGDVNQSQCDCRCLAPSRNLTALGKGIYWAIAAVTTAVVAIPCTLLQRKPMKPGLV